MAKVETQADKDVQACLEGAVSFALVAGAGSGKTSSLIDALEWVREHKGKALRQNGQRVACITYTKRAVAVISERLGFDDLYAVSTLHSFLWAQFGRFHLDIRQALEKRRLPDLIAKERTKDNGGQSKAAREARAKAERYELDLAALAAVEQFDYGDAVYGDYPNGVLGHDDIIIIASYLLEENATFRRILGLRFPYIFVDEAQDTAETIVRGLNLACEDEGLPIVGYFGDPWQQIYDETSEDFAPPLAGKTITKVENFRCSRSVIRLLNGFRTDVAQVPAGKNQDVEGSVVFRLVKAEAPEEPRNRYSDAQTERALAQMDQAMADWGWTDRDDVVKLFLVRQMIARRMGFATLNRLFSGQFASTRAQDAFERGEHFLLLPLTSTIWPLVEAHRADNSRRVIDILRQQSPAFAVDGINASKSLRSMVDTSIDIVAELATLWEAATIGDILRCAADKQIIRVGERLQANLVRDPRAEIYDAEQHGLEKGDWLADTLFGMTTSEVAAYTSFVGKNTAFSTQHGVKGEEYPKVLVVYDDVEAAWHNYNFGKLLTPGISGAGTDKQEARGRKLAYVSFSRALEDLRVLFFTTDPTAARAELIAKGLLTADQIELIS
ncbi:UvrD-helicase domain-containing protein [Shinella daejeonensis]|uniref:UvrD-helicase domain-containing protein n=1 Tax=Shinella daejeonensis TaxID=659017 RepID=UPI0020C7664E|nr:UvrD-helicase domain-containing protein [Shinella daejeonensis]MCP8896034.1 UvrD-helicase domain-containing protein [Shinella daejeonensis]